VPRGELPAGRASALCAAGRLARPSLAAMAQTRHSALFGAPGRASRLSQSPQGRARRSASWQPRRSLVYFQV